MKALRECGGFLHLGDLPLRGPLPIPGRQSGWGLPSPAEASPVGLWSQIHTAAVSACRAGSAVGISFTHSGLIRDLEEEEPVKTGFTQPGPTYCGTGIEGGDMRPKALLQEAPYLRTEALRLVHGDDHVGHDEDRVFLLQSGEKGDSAACDLPGSQAEPQGGSDIPLL